MVRADCFSHFKKMKFLKTWETHFWRHQKYGLGVAYKIKKKKARELFNLAKKVKTVSSNYTLKLDKSTLQQENRSSLWG